MPRTRRLINLPPPYLKRISFDASADVDWDEYPFSLRLFRKGAFELSFDAAITVIVGENGSGKSTLLEGIAALAGFDEAGGGKGFRPVDHSRAIESSGAKLADAMRAAWLPKLSNGWFFRAESFFSVARYLDLSAIGGGGVPPDFLSHSHGEGFLRFFAERLKNQALYLFDEPESALSPRRQVEFIRTLKRLEPEARFQIVMATHSPILMAYPGARLIAIRGDKLQPTRLKETDNFRLLSAFCADPEGFLADGRA